MTARRALLVAMLVIAGIVSADPVAEAKRGRKNRRARTVVPVPAAAARTERASLPALRMDSALHGVKPRCVTCIQISDAKLGSRVGVTSSTSIYGDRLRLYLKVDEKSVDTSAVRVAFDVNYNSGLFSLTSMF